MDTMLCENFPPQNLIFTDVLSRRTAYGLIWLGRYQIKDQMIPCVVKMIMLTTGFHYDKSGKVYCSPDGKIMTEDQSLQYFGRNDPKPFLHVDFRHRRSMTPKAFFTELEELIKLGELHIAPKVYGCGLNRSHDIHYAFIIMEKVDCSLKDIYLYRDLHHEEKKIVTDLIAQLHERHGIIHGDLKPSNIGVYLKTRDGSTRDQRVYKACFFDCQKIKHRENMNTETFHKLSRREAENYKKHITKNKTVDRRHIETISAK